MPVHQTTRSDEMLSRRQIERRSTRIRDSWTPLERQQRRREAQWRRDALWALVSGSDDMSSKLCY